VFEMMIQSKGERLIYLVQVIPVRCSPNQSIALGGAQVVGRSVVVCNCDNDTENRLGLGATNDDRQSRAA